MCGVYYHVKESLFIYLVNMGAMCDLQLSLGALPAMCFFFIGEKLLFKLYSLINVLKVCAAVGRCAKPSFV